MNTLTAVSKSPIFFDINIANDSLGISMSIIIVKKLTAFILMMMIISLRDYHLQYQILQSKLLGHNNFQTWILIVFPQLLPKIFVPFLISIVYAIAPVSISNILGHRFLSSFDLIIQELLSRINRGAFISRRIIIFTYDRSRKSIVCPSFQN